MTFENKKSLNKELSELNIMIEDLKSNPNKKITIKEIYNLTINSRYSLKKLFTSILRPNICYSHTNFEKSVLNCEFDKIIQNIVCDFIVNNNDKLYFVNTLNNAFPINDEVTNKLLELLLINDEWQLARSLSSKNLFYKFTDIYDEKFPKNSLIHYMFGNYEFESDLEFFNISSSTNYLFNNLEPKSKEYVTKILIENYRHVLNAYNYGKENGKDFKKDEYCFSYTIWVDEYKSYYVHGQISDIYKSFDEEGQREVIKILNSMGFKA